MSHTSIVLLWARLLSYLSSTDAMRVQRAYHLARHAHEGQSRDGTRLPYMVHPLQVALILAEEVQLSEPGLISAALLHDTLEDTELSGEEIERVCGEEVRAVVERLTKPPATRATKQERDTVYFKGIASGPLNVRLVKCADRLDNLRSLHELGDPVRLDRYIKATRRYLLPISARTSDYLYNALLEQCGAEVLSGADL